MSMIFARDPSKILAVNARLIKRTSADNEFFYEVKQEEVK